ncbi:MAG TPA: DoxX family membrane protein [Terriglobales bacterium]
MNWLRRIVSKETFGPDLVRLTVCAILFTHGVYRFYMGEVTGLGDILQEEGVPAGHLLAFLITLAETAGSTLLALRILAVPISLILSLIYFTGIMMFNRHRGFFVVGGHANGGWEYNALLIACLLATAWNNRNRPWL